jgi:hypothetical protein
MVSMKVIFSKINGFWGDPGSDNKDAPWVSMASLVSVIHAGGNGMSRLMIATLTGRGRGIGGISIGGGGPSGKGGVFEPLTTDDDGCRGGMVGTGGGGARKEFIYL